MSEYQRARKKASINKYNKIKILIKYISITY